MKKSWLTDQKEEEQAKRNDHINVENVVNLVLILSLVAVFACSIRWESAKGEIIITDKIINRELIDSTKLDTVSSTKQRN